jgi:hypothetical protein
MISERQAEMKNARVVRCGHFFVGEGFVLNVMPPSRASLAPTGLVSTI